MQSLLSYSPKQSVAGTVTLQCPADHYLPYAGSPNSVNISCEEGDGLFTLGNTRLDYFGGCIKGRLVDKNWKPLQLQ